MKKIQRQDQTCVMKPPTGGPSTGAASAGHVSVAKRRMSSAGAVVLRTTSRPTGTIKAPAAPWSMRDAVKDNTP